MKYTSTKSEELMKNMAIIILAFTTVYGLYMYTMSPDTLPSHFNLEGEVDSYSSKTVVLLIVGINLLLYFLLSYAATKPKYFNYPVKINEKNAQIQYDNIIQLQVRIKLIITIIFLFLIWLMVDYERVTQMQLEKLPFVMILILLITITYYIWKAFDIERRLK